MSFAKGAENKLSRLRKRGAYDHESVFGVLRAGLMAHVAFARSEAHHGGFPVCLPLLYGVDEVHQSLYLHGSVSGGLFKSLRGDDASTKVCVTVTLLDGIVVARSLFHSSCNYRSVCVFGEAVLVEDEQERLKGMRLITEQAIAVQRWEDAREPNPSELKSTAVLRVHISSASAKKREGGVGDDKEDVQADHYWAGVIPVNRVMGEPVTEADCTQPTPDYLRK